jgi:hypothetical protein
VQHTCVLVLLLQTRGGKMTVSGVLQHIWKNEGVPGLFRYTRSRQLAHDSSVAACMTAHRANSAVSVQIGPRSRNSHWLHYCSRVAVALDWSC